MKAEVMSLDEAEFSARILKIKRRLYCTAYSILWNEADCLDAMQEAAARAWMHRGRLRNEDFFETWFTRILINKCKALLRKRKGEGALTEDIAAARRDMPADIDLKNALRRLKPKYRLPLILHYQDGYSLKEAAQILDLKEALVKSRLHQARRELRHLLGGEENET